MPTAEDQAVVAAVLERAATEAEWDHQIAAAVADADVGAAVREPVALAFRFHAQDDSEGQRFGPMITTTEGRPFPGPLPEVPDETCALWEAIAARVQHPWIRARLNDLLFERRWPPVGPFAREAAQAYLELADGFHPPSMTTVDSLCRAAVLSRVTKDEDIAEQVFDRLRIAAQESLDDPSPKPGVALRLIETVLDAGGNPDELLS